MATCTKANMSRIEKPATCSMPVFPTRSQTEILRTARETMSTCAKCLRQQTHLTAEQSVLNRLLYMKHGQLRREKSYQGLKQIRTCLNRFSQVGLDKLLQEFLTYFEDAIIQEGIQARLPSRQMWEYLLTQFLGAATILSNTASRCAAVFLQAHRHLTTGSLIATNVLFLALLSRIWACCQALCFDLQTWYRTLRPVVDVLVPTDAAWLSQGETLPTDLSMWLIEQGFSSGLDSQRGKGSSDDSLAELMAKYQKHMNQSNVEEAGDAEEASDESKENPLPVSEKDTMYHGLDEDLGAPVSISEIKMANEDKGSPAAEEPDKASQACALPTFKKKILEASTIRDLQLHLKKFRKNLPDCGTDKQRKKCATLLADLQSQSQLLESKGQEDRVQNLLAQGKKKLLKFIRMSASKAHNLNQSKGKVQKKKKKKPKNNLKVSVSETKDLNQNEVNVSMKNIKNQKQKKFAVIRDDRLNEDDYGEMKGKSHYSTLSKTSGSDQRKKTKKNLVKNQKKAASAKQKKEKKQRKFDHQAPKLSDPKKKKGDRKHYVLKLP